LGAIKPKGVKEEASPITDAGEGKISYYCSIVF
jgi:hypothetical protein